MSAFRLPIIMLAASVLAFLVADNGAFVILVQTVTVMGALLREWFWPAPPPPPSYWEEWR